MPFERLSKDVVPVNYELTVKPDFTTYTFDGNLVLEIEVSN